MKVEINQTIDNNNFNKVPINNSDLQEVKFQKKKNSSKF